MVHAHLYRGDLFVITTRQQTGYFSHGNGRWSCFIMKVVMISKALVVGAYHKKLDELASLGVDLHVVVPPAWGSLPLEIDRSEAYHLYPLPIYFSGKNHFHLYRRLFPLIKRLKPDIIHIDEEHYSLVTIQAMICAKRAGAKALFFTWQNICKKYPFPFTWMEQYNFRIADFAIAGNEGAKEVLVKKGFKKNIAVIPQFGVDPEIFQKRDASALRLKLGVKPDTFVIGYMGRLVKEKGVGDLLDAAARLQVNYTVLLIGGGTEAENIRRRTREMVMEQKVLFINQVKSFDVPEYLNCMDCLVLPSLTKPNWKEQFGRVLIEAMACEVPVIGSSSGEIPGVIGDAGLVFQEGQSHDLYNKLSLIEQDNRLRKELGRKGRQRVLEHFTQKIIAKATYDVYNDILNSKITH